MIVESEHLNRKPKVLFTHGLLPNYIDPAQPPAKEKPWSVLLRQQWSSSVELVLDRRLYDEIKEVLKTISNGISWSRVVLPLKALLEDEFFNIYIKAGNISMLSQGRPGQDPLYKLHKGVLRLELPKELYERAGLVGNAIPDGGRKHVKTRFAVDLNLRQPSMVRGKKGFERIVWAFKNVLTEPLVWVFHDHWQSKTMETGSVPISVHNPLNRTSPPSITHMEDALVPSMRSWCEDPERSDDDAVDLLDWLGMASLDSPRLSAVDPIDPFLSRYQVPEAELATMSNIVRLVWPGFIQGDWVHKLLIECITATRKRTDFWYAISAKSIAQNGNESYDGYTILRTQPKDTSGVSSNTERPEFIMWELQSCNSG